MLPLLCAAAAAEQALLDDPQRSAKMLARLALEKGFDGWLINIEAAVPVQVQTGRDRQTDTVRQTYRQTDMQTDQPTNRPTDLQTDRQAVPKQTNAMCPRPPLLTAVLFAAAGKSQHLLGRATRVWRGGRYVMPRI